ncbi:MAG: lytic transglycosylase domain-containing protein [Rhizobiaceae bacterium]
MKKLMFVTAAIAAVMIGFAANAQDAQPAASAGKPPIDKVTKSEVVRQGRGEQGQRKQLERHVLDRGMLRILPHVGSEQSSVGQAEPVGLGKRPVLTAFARGETIVKGREGPGIGIAVGGKTVGGQYHELVNRYATTYGVPIGLAHAVISVESNYRPNARGKAGEIGLMQIKPATAKLMGYSGKSSGLFNPETNIRFGMKYLGMAHRLGGGTTCGTILKYNAGHGAKRMNPISAAYCKKVQRRLGS